MLSPSDHLVRPGTTLEIRLLLSQPAESAQALVASSLAGYALAVYRFRGNVLLFAMFVAGNFTQAGGGSFNIASLSGGWWNADRPVSA